MATVKMIRAPKAAGNNGKHFPGPGETLETDDARAAALVHYGYAEPVKAESKPDPEPEPETKTDDDAEKRETATADESKPAKRGPGRPPKKAADK